MRRHSRAEKPRQLTIYEINKLPSSRLQKTAKVLAPLAAVAALASLSGDSLTPRSLGPIWDRGISGDTGGNITKKDYDILADRPAITVSRSSFLDGNVTISGFNVAVNTKSLSRQLKPNEELEVKLVDPSDSAGHTAIGNVLIDSPKARMADYDIREVPQTIGDPSMGDMFSPQKLDDEGVDYIAGGLLDVNDQLLEITKYRFATKKIKDFGLMPVKHTTHLEERQVWPVIFRPNLNCAGVSERLVSEVRLTPAYYQRVCGYLATIGSIIPKDQTVFLDYIRSPLDAEDSEDPDAKTVLLSIPFPKDELGHSRAYGTVLHESLHAEYSEIPKDSQVYKNLSSAYLDMISSMKYRLPTPDEQYYGYEVGKNEPGWAAITESTYEDSVLGVKDSPAGHPWDNPTEMSSSTSAVMAVYPKQFVERFETLDKARQNSVKSAVSATLEQIEYAVGPSGLPKIIPGANYIKEKLGLK